MNSVVLASGNQHKIEELSNYLQQLGIQVHAPKKQIEVIEDGISFEQNSYKKAYAYFQQEQTPVLSDDSGLVVNALPNELGIHSKRFGGEELDARGKNQLLIEKLKDVEGDKRNAYFVCQLCLMMNPEEVYFFEGRVKGHIGEEILGDKGFGYDPVFMPEAFEIKRSMAQEAEWKQDNSHRANALAQLVKFLESRRNI
jgi:XTP/dITP diphosphohydrolase